MDKLIGTMSVGDILKSNRNLLKDELVWKYLLERDYPLYSSIDDGWQYTYRRLMCYKSLSRKFGKVWIQEKTLKYIDEYGQKDDLDNYIANAKSSMDYEAKIATVPNVIMLMALVRDDKRLKSLTHYQVKQFIVENIRKYPSIHTDRMYWFNGEVSVKPIDTSFTRLGTKTLNEMNKWIGNMILRNDKELFMDLLLSQDEDIIRRYVYDYLSLKDDDEINKTPLLLLIRQHQQWKDLETGDSHLIEIFGKY